MFPYVPYNGVPVVSAGRIRAGDKVRVVLCGRIHKDGQSGKPWHEHLWLLVISVTSFGMVTGLPLAESKKCPISPKAGLFSFPNTTVVGVVHGKNWENCD